MPFVLQPKLVKAGQPHDVTGLQRGRNLAEKAVDHLGCSALVEPERLHLRGLCDVKQYDLDDSARRSAGGLSDLERAARPEWPLPKLLVPPAASPLRARRSWPVRWWWSWRFQDAALPTSRAAWKVAPVQGQREVVCDGPPSAFHGWNVPRLEPAGNTCHLKRAIPVIHNVLQSLTQPEIGSPGERGRRGPTSGFPTDRCCFHR